MGCDVHATDSNGFTPLHVAAKNDQMNCAEALIVEFNADVNVRANNGATPLYLAASRGCANTIRGLARLLADPNALGRLQSTAAAV